MIIFGLFVMAIFMLMDLVTFNKVFDVVVPIYAIASLVTIVYYYKLKRNVHLEDDIDSRKFAFKKASRIENLTWKQKFFGEFIKHERTGLAEFFMFNGAPGFIARSMASDNFTQIIEHKEGDESVIRVKTLGTPLVEGALNKVGNSEDELDYVEYLDYGKPMKAKYWFDEESKELRMKYFDKKNWSGYQVRKLLDDNTLHISAELTNLEGKKASYTCVCKRKA